MDGVQIPVVAAETEGRIGRIEGQRARTRECKLGCVFTQTAVDKDGWATREPDSTTYVGAVETAEEFGFRIYTEAWRRGWEWAAIKIVIADGAVWIWNLADQHFPGAIQNRRSLSCPTTFMECRRPASSPGSGSEKALDDSHEGPVG